MAVTGARTEKRRLLPGAAIVLIVAAILGGGGRSHALAELAINATALLVLAWLLAWPLPQRSRGAAAPLLLLAAGAALIALQLIPLPAALWRALPGRELASTIADQIGAGQRAHPLTLDPPATARALAVLLPGAAMLLLVVHMDLGERLGLVRVMIGCAVFSLLLGLIQFLTDGAVGTLYPEGHVGYATGLFANRNHQASFLLVAIALVSVFAIRRSLSTVLAVVLIMALAAGVVATTSRAGLLLLPFALLPMLFTHVRGRWLVPALVLLGIGLAVYGLVESNAVVRVVIHRLRDGNMGRLLFWEDSWKALVQYWPVGSGFGTFVKVFQTVEPLDHVGVNYVNHAHNEYIEALLEGGLPAGLLIVAGLGWWLWTGFRIFRSKRRDAPLARAAWTGLGLLLLHSLVDYPARMLAIEAAGAMLAGFMTVPAGAAGTSVRKPLPHSAPASLVPAGGMR